MSELLSDSGVQKSTPPQASPCTYDQNPARISAKKHYTRYWQHYQWQHVNNTHRRVGPCPTTYSGRSFLWWLLAYSKPTHPGPTIFQNIGSKFSCIPDHWDAGNPYLIFLKVSFLGLVLGSIIRESTKDHAVFGTNQEVWANWLMSNQGHPIPIMTTFTIIIVENQNIQRTHTENYMVLLETLILWVIIKVQLLLRLYMMYKVLLKQFLCLVLDGLLLNRLLH